MTKKLWFIPLILIILISTVFADPTNTPTPLPTVAMPFEDTFIRLTPVINPGSTYPNLTSTGIPWFDNDSPAFGISHVLIPGNPYVEEELGAINITNVAFVNTNCYDVTITAKTWDSASWTTFGFGICFRMTDPNNGFWFGSNNELGDSVYNVLELTKIQAGVPTALTTTSDYLGICFPPFSLRVVTNHYNIQCYVLDASDTEYLIFDESDSMNYTATNHGIKDTQPDIGPIFNDFKIEGETCNVLDTSTETETETPIPPSYTETVTVTETETGTATETTTATATDTEIPTGTATQTITATDTTTDTDTPTTTETETCTITETATPTITMTGSVTRTHTRTTTSTRTATNTKTATHTRTSTNTKTETRTQTPTGTVTATKTETATFTRTYTRTLTATRTNTPVTSPTMVIISSTHINIIGMISDEFGTPHQFLRYSNTFAYGKNITLVAGIAGAKIRVINMFLSSQAVMTVTLKQTNGSIVTSPITLNDLDKLIYTQDFSCDWGQSLMCAVVSQNRYLSIKLDYYYQY